MVSHASFSEKNVPIKVMRDKMMIILLYTLYHLSSAVLRPDYREDRVGGWAGFGEARFKILEGNHNQFVSKRGLSFPSFWGNIAVVALKLISLH